MPLIEARIGGRNDAEEAFKFLFSKIGKAIFPWPDTSVPRDEKGCYGPVPPDFLLRPGFVLFEDAIVINNTSMILCRNNTFYPQLCYHNPPRFLEVCASIKNLKKDGSCEVNIPDEIDYVDQPSVLIGNADVYYFWIFYHITRFWLIQMVQNRNEVKHVLNSRPNSFQQQTLELLQIDSTDFGCLNPSATKFRQLYLPVGIHRSSFTHPGAIKWLRTQLLPLDSCPHRRIFLSRQDAARRRLLNEEKIINRLKPHGFEVVVPSSLSVADQIEVFSQAEIVVGPHGSGFANMVFASSQAKMIEIHSPHWALGFYRSLAWMMGQQHGQVIGFTRGPSEDPMQDYLVNPGDVESLVLEKLAEKK
ncbi:TPA: glycosyltransferase family 61 protein [Candidatus Poribacteria bacterium]|nr:glycosyltransferase family 61 protein [Candidatus Poribacteria bacterium]